MSDDRRAGIQRLIAAAMVEAINASDSMSAIIRAEQVADPKKRLETLPIGTLILDVIGQGAERRRIDRESLESTFVVSVAVHGRLPGAIVTNEILDDSSRIVEQVSEFLWSEADSLPVAGYDEFAVLIAETPFPLSREALYGHGLFLQIMQFSWQFAI